MTYVKHDGYLSDVGAVVFDYSFRWYADGIVELVFWRKCLYFDSDFNDTCFHEFDWIHPSIESDIGFVSIRQQTTIWKKDCIVYWRIYASLNLNKLRVHIKQ